MTGKNLCIAVDGNTLIISGSVLFPAVRDAIESVAWKTPGIECIQNDLFVEPLELIDFAPLT